MLLPSLVSKIYCVIRDRRVGESTPVRMITRSQAAEQAAYAGDATRCRPPVPLTSKSNDRFIVILQSHPWFGALEHSRHRACQI
jgi:hypothetical protein